MQRYRVNLPLLISLVVGTVVVGGGSYFVYQAQKSRNANRLIERANTARAEGDLEKTAQLLGEYVRMRKDDADAMVELANTWADMAEDPQAEPKRIREALGLMEATIRDHPDRTELRRRLVDFYMSPRIRMLKPALDHVSQLLARKPNDPELEVMRNECYFAAADQKRVDHAFTLIGYDPATDEFKEGEAIAPGDPGVYARAAATLRNDRFEQELADRVMDRMLEVNPDNGRAYLAMGRYEASKGESERAEELIAKAAELAPNDADVVVASTRVLIQDEKYDEAEAVVEVAIKDGGPALMLYQTLAELAIVRKDVEGALAACDRGIGELPPEQAPLLLLQKARLQLQGDDPNAAKATIKQLREGEFVPSAYPEYLEARLKMIDGEWFAAAQAFEEYQSFMSRIPGLGVELQMMLGICRERLGQDELALQAYDAALQIDSRNKAAQAGRSRVISKTGRGGGRGGINIYRSLSIELAKPEAEQDWEAFDELAIQYVEQMQLPEGMDKVLQGEVLMRRGKYKEARKKLVGAYEANPENLGVRRAAVKLFAADPDQGAARALKLLERVVDDFGDLPILRLEKADLLAQIGDEDLTDQLYALGEGTDDWNTQQKVQLWRGLAQKFSVLRDPESRRDCLARVADLAPGELPTLMELYELALESGEMPAIEDAQDRVLKVVGSRDDPVWLYTEARRLLVEHQRSAGQGNALEEADELVARALAQRGEWDDLHRLKASIALARGNEQAALASFDNAARYGRPTARSLFQHVKLLMRQGRYADALERIETVEGIGRTQLLGQDYAECLRRLGRVADASVAADEFAAQVPNNAAGQLWYGRFLSTLSVAPSATESFKEATMAKAGEAFAKSVELNPTSPDAWLARVGYLAATGARVEAEQALRKAELALPEDETLILLARGYEIIGRGMDAESLYSQALSRFVSNRRPAIVRLAAKFYLGPAYRGADRLQKATPLLNELLKLAADGELASDDANVRWARTQAARLMARGGTYAQLRDAERLLRSNATDGQLPAADRALMAEILTPRPEPVSRMKAASLLEELSRDQKLTKQSDLALGRLYFSLDEWRKCREQMLNVIARYPKDEEVRLAYLDMLLKRGGSREIDRAVRQLERLREIAPKSLATREMIARVAFEKGRKEQASKAMLSLLPRRAEAIGPDQMGVIGLVVRRLIEFDDLERAEKLVELAATKGGLREQLDRGEFIGVHRDTAAGMAALAELKGEAPLEELVRRGTLILRAAERRGEVLTEEQLGLVEGWLASLIREEPEAIAPQLQRGDLLDLKQDYKGAADVYREMLARGDLSGTGRAIVLNNLAYLLALSSPNEQAVSEATGYIDEAVELLGPNTDILDTRAVVLMAAGRYEDAVRDLELAVIDRPTALKFYHLARAYSLGGRDEEAAAAWKKSLELGLARKEISRLERDEYERFRQKMEGVSLTQAG
ncbi:MAG: hypothetical protein AAF805_05840 [Planctomycetota bacterium]